MDNLPDNIFFKILLPLPAKSLLHFKLVCKSWRSHISNPDFVKRHVLRTTNNPNNDLFIAHNFFCSHQLNVIDTNFLDRAIHVSNDIGSCYDYVIVGSCNGLLCIAYKCGSQRFPNKLCLWNPAYKNVKDIKPRYAIEVNPTLDQVFFGFGFDHATSDYKVVRIVQTNLVKPLINRVEVYSLNENSWKEIEVKLELGKIHTLHPPATVNGSIYWIIRRTTNTAELVVLCFNVQSLTFSTISLPFNLRIACCEYPSRWDLCDLVKVFEFKESVAIMKYMRYRDRDRPKGVVIYMLDDDSSWIKKWNIKCFKLFVGWLKTGEFVGINLSGKIVLYDSVNEYISRTYKYSESLLKPILPELQTYRAARIC